MDLGDALTFVQVPRIVALAAKYHLPASYLVRRYTDLGGLVAYGPDFADLVRRAAGYVDKILKGTKPSDLPVEQPTKYELIINMKTAKALGLSVPTSLLVRADRVIEWSFLAAMHESLAWVTIGSIPARACKGQA